MKKRIIISLFALSLLCPIYAQHHHQQQGPQPKHHHRQQGPQPEHHGPAYPAQQTNMCAASIEQVNLIMSYLRSISFDSERLKAAQLIVAICPLYVEDIVQIMNLFTFDDARTALLKTAYPLCVDPQNYHMAVNRLTFRSNQDDVWHFIEQR